MKQYSEFELHRAFEDVAAGCHIRQAARNWGIPYPTLRHRLYGTQSRDKHSCHYNTAFSLTRVIGYAGSICINLNFTSLNLGLPYVADSGELGIRVNFDSLVLPFRTVVNLGLEELDFVLGSS
ncbi:transposase [Colletotrichum incanum]|uniref:Transposase n=1 Tax=Colletotrichum incanum TaxID=1573173 RepID=A0A166P842_COLIC|nr:transposase [Colletotrichum incanum]